MKARSELSITQNMDAIMQRQLIGSKGYLSLMF
jgi:hypothetical protein